MFSLVFINWVKNTDMNNTSPSSLLKIVNSLADSICLWVINDWHFVDKPEVPRQCGPPRVSVLPVCWNITTNNTAVERPGQRLHPFTARTPPFSTTHSRRAGGDGRGNVAACRRGHECAFIYSLLRQYLAVSDATDKATPTFDK